MTRRTPALDPTARRNPRHAAARECGTAEGAAFVAGATLVAVLIAGGFLARLLGVIS